MPDEALDKAGERGVPEDRGGRQEPRVRAVRRLDHASPRHGEVLQEACGCDTEQARQDLHAATTPDGCHVPSSQARELGLPPDTWIEQRGRCGICLEPMRADEIENGAVSRIRPESAGGRRVKENCQVVHQCAPHARGRNGKELWRLRCGSGLGGSWGRDPARAGRRSTDRDPFRSALRVG